MKNILDKVQYIHSLEAVKDLFPFYADEHAMKTWEVISEVLELVPDKKENVVLTHLLILTIIMK